MSTAPNAQTKDLDADRLRTEITRWLRGDNPDSPGMSLRHFCLQVCEPQVDPSNLSDFRRGKRSGMTAQTVATVARAMGFSPGEFYDDGERQAWGSRVAAVRVILNDADAPLSPKDVHRAMLEQGRDDDYRLVSNTLVYLEERGEAHRPEPGVWLAGPGESKDGAAA